MVGFQTRRRGSIYVLTLMTVAAVGSMVLIGVTVRGATSAESTMTEQLNENGDGVTAAAEYALARIDNDANWATNAQKGTVFAEFTLGGKTYTSSVVDQETQAAPTLTTTTYEVQITSTSGIARDSSSFQLDYQVAVDYAQLLKTEGAMYYWPLNESSGESVADELMNGTDGGYQDKSAVGAGTNDEGGTVPVFNDNLDHVRVPHDSGFDNGKGAFSLWINHANSNPLKLTGIMGIRYNGAGDTPTFSMSIFNRALIVMVCDNGNYQVDKFTYTGSDKISDDTWHHVAVNYGSDTGVQIYIDGVLEVENTSNTDAINSVNKHSLLIGAGHSISSWSNSREGFVGSVAHVAIFHEPLTSRQIDLLSTTKPDAQALSLVEHSWQQVYD